MNLKAAYNVRDDLEDCPDYYWTKISPYPASVRAWGAMLLAVGDDGRISWSKLGETTPGEAKRFESTISWIDLLTNGGYYGLAVLGGRPGLGKSMLGRAASMQAAASGDWNVIHIDAEHPADELEEKFQTYIDQHAGAEAAIDNLRIVHVPRGITIEDLVVQIGEVIGDDRPVLTVVDSINTIAQLMRGPYLDNLRDLALWAMMARRISRGSASFLMMSELNKLGGAKGGNLEHWADVFVQLDGDRQAGWVTVTLKKTRSTAGEGQQKKMVRLPQITRFLTEAEASDRSGQGERGTLTAVGGDDQII